MLPVTERRLTAEWTLLEQLADINRGRLTHLSRRDPEFTLRLHGPDRMSIPKQHTGHTLSVHDLRFVFPVHFPAVPMELYLQIPVVHPNVHPETGFVCLWDRHRVSNTVEHAMHKLVAMLAGRLWNAEPLHLMQPEALPVEQYTAMPLQGVTYDLLPERFVTPERRRRLS